MYGFETKATVCDGASANLSVIKLPSGFGSGTYGNKPPGSCIDIHEVQAWFLNPFTNKKVFTIICPSHQVHDTTTWWTLLGEFDVCVSLTSQLKNMVAALYASQEGKTKNSAMKVWG